MSTLYYTYSDRYPKVIKLALYRILIFIAQTLYPEDYIKDPLKATRRIMISDMQAGGQYNQREAIKNINENPVKKAIEAFEGFSKLYPFTAYSLSDFEDGDTKNFTAHSGKTFSPDTGRKIALFQKSFTIPMVTFFNKADDMQRAMTQLKFANATLTRLDVPITINQIQQEFHPELPDLAIDTTFPVDLDITISKGQFAYEFQQYLTENKIFDVKHDIKVKYHDFSLSEYLGDQTIQQMILKLEQTTEDTSLSLINQYIITLPGLPYVTSINPSSSTSVPVTTNSISITFSNPMNEQKTVAGIKIAPVVPSGVSDIEWTLDSTVLTYHLYGDLQGNQKYTLSFPRESIVDMYGNHPENDYMATFSTL